MWQIGICSRRSYLQQTASMPTGTTYFNTLFSLFKFSLASLYNVLLFTEINL